MERILFMENLKRKIFLQKKKLEEGVDVLGKIANRIFF